MHVDFCFRDCTSPLFRAGRSSYLSRTECNERAHSRRTTRETDLDCNQPWMLRDFFIISKLRYIDKIRYKLLLLYVLVINIRV